MMRLLLLLGLAYLMTPLCLLKAVGSLRIWELRRGSRAGRAVIRKLVALPSRLMMVAQLTILLPL